jgi:pantothenate kinase type III
MTKKTLASLLLLIAVGCTLQKPETKKPAAVPEDPDRFALAAFRDPAMTYRSVPFYSLNDELDPAELDRQLRTFKDGGFGGSFLHSRIGLLTEYLSDRWFEIMAAGVKSSQALGIDAWFYDEDKWPSGFAGGIVPLKNPEFQARSLVRVKKDQPVSAPDAVLFEDAEFKYVGHVYPMGDPWFNGTAWVDLMNPDMVKAFIDCSYTPYIQKFGGKPHVLGTFTDEPQISPRPKIANQGAISYSPVIPAAFKARTGQELAPLMPSLFAEVGDWRKVRLDYYRTVAACFEQAFSKQIGDTCATNAFVWTGHYNGEDSPTSNMLNEGDLMQQLRHMQMPGIDALGLHYNTLHCGKVMTSVANQYGRRRRLSELFGISGHNMTFEDRMWITSWHTLMGVNFMCPHLSLYSMKGERKRDYPPTISPHQPYWRYNKLFEDFSARLCYFATVGQTVPEVCVLSPIESDYIESASGGAGKRHAAFEELLNALLRTHRNVDIGDEQILSEIGKAEGGRFVVGQMAYRAVVVPPMLTIRASTSQKYFHLKPLIVEPGIKTGMPIFYDNPKEVGADRIVNAVAAYARKRQSLIVVDFGTATTFDVITVRGEYLGGAIAPGLVISAEALCQRASKLPRVEIACPSQVIARNTVSSMQSGLFYGYIGLVDGIVARMKQELREDPCVLATGGLAGLVAPHSQTIDEVIPDLTLEGLRIIFERNRQRET